MVIAGLPFAGVAGWALGAPAGRPAALGAQTGLGDPRGEGGIGSAPIGATSDGGAGSATGGAGPRVTADPGQPAATPSGGPTVVVTTVTVIRPADPETTRSTRPPRLTEPPVPTPTRITDPPGPTDIPDDPTSTTEPGIPEPSDFFEEEVRYRSYQGPGWWRFVRSGRYPVG
ncbi:hypothetical protein [Actinoplanes couchii]|uniref:hypothetical protein n=1 Tax=Actinoplanes couchii TaxID=403638 RepID=UPI001943048D|nr:hypothetical protein [Actinoplanes couchii]MDR6324931.1 hypothetical protein [Actinoplanes couchii]